LLASKAYWTEWFTGLTNCFLDLRIPKQLLLAGNDRMDKDLTIAHMQGRFKMVVVDNVGHVI
jgi:protein phosphatase methylesterase 1